MKFSRQLGHKQRRDITFFKEKEKLALHFINKQLKFLTGNLDSIVLLHNTYVCSLIEK